jgi:hypothetical protein
MHLKHGATEAGMAAQLWNTMRDTEAGGEWMGDYSALLPKHVYALQAADLFAYELTHEFESICGKSGRKMQWAMKQFVNHDENNAMFVNAFVSPIIEQIASGTTSNFQPFQEKVMTMLHGRALE